MKILAYSKNKKSKNTVLLLTGLFTALLSGVVHAQSSAFDGSWSGSFNSSAEGQGCTYHVKKSIISHGKVHWKATRTSCSSLACGYCPQNESFTNPVTIAGKYITFSVKENNNPYYLVTLTLSNSGNKLSGHGNIEYHNARYHIALTKDK